MELIILNYDQYINYDLNLILEYFRRDKVDGGVITFNSIHPRWSYAKIKDKQVLETAEKNPISNNAIAGFYYFKKGLYFLDSAFDVIRHDDNFDERYYTSSIYNQMILKNLQIQNYHISKENYFSFYSVQKLNEFKEYLKINYVES